VRGHNISIAPEPQATQPAQRVCFESSDRALWARSEVVCREHRAPRTRLSKDRAPRPARTSPPQPGALQFQDTRTPSSRSLSRAPASATAAASAGGDVSGTTVAPARAGGGHSISAPRKRSSRRTCRACDAPSTARLAVHATVRRHDELACGAHGQDVGERADACVLVFVGRITERVASASPRTFFDRALARQQSRFETARCRVARENPI